MSLISEQVKELRELANEIWLNTNEKFGIKINEAADTIEALSVKPDAENMERPDRYYGGGWIACEDRLPEDDTCVLVQVSGKHKNITFENAFEFATHIKGEGWVLEVYPDWHNPNIVAWQPLPEPYKPK